MLQIDGFRIKKINNILESIEKSKTKPFYNLLSALSIPSLSIVKAKKLSELFSDLNIFILALENNK